MTAAKLAKLGDVSDTELEYLRRALSALREQRAANLQSTQLDGLRAYALRLPLAQLTAALVVAARHGFGADNGESLASWLTAQLAQVPRS